MARVAIAAIAGAIVGGTFGVLGRWRVTEPAAQNFESDSRVLAEFETVSRLLESMNVRLAALATHEPSTAVRQVETGAGTTGAALTEQVVELKALLNQLRDQVSAATSGGNVYHQELPDVPKDAPALRGVFDGMSSGNDVANAKHFLWTPPDVYRRYGKPDGVGSSQGETTWQYVVNESEDGTQYLVFHFMGGYFSRSSRYLLKNPAK